MVTVWEDATDEEIEKAFLEDCEYYIVYDKSWIWLESMKWLPSKFILLNHRYIYSRQKERVGKWNEIEKLLANDFSYCCIIEWM